MLIVVIANGEDQKEFQDKEIPEGVQVQFVNSLDEAKDTAHAYFYLLDNDIDATANKISSLSVPVFIKSGSDLRSLPPNVAKISPWPGFLFAESIQVEVGEEGIAAVAAVLDELQWKYTHIPTKASND